MRLLFPSFAELSNKGKFDEIAKISNKSVKYVSIVFVPIIIFFVGFSEPFLVFVFGADSYKSTKVMQILVLAVYVEAIRRPYNVQVLSSGNLRYAMLIATVIMLSNSILNLIMIPQKIFGINTLGLGAEGASLATLLSFTFGFILSKYYSYRITGTKIYIRIWIHIFAGIVSLLLIYYFSIMGITPILIPVYYLISLIMYFTILFLLNEFRRKELNFFLNAINPKKMKDYIQSEIKN